LPCFFPIQLFFGHLNGKYVAKHQPAKMAAIEGRWNDEKPASEVLIAWPDVEKPAGTSTRSRLPPPFGSLIDSDSLTAGGSRAQQYPPGELAAGAHSILHVPDHGWLWIGHVGACLARILFEPQRSHRTKPPSCFGLSFSASRCPSLPSSPAGTRRRWGRQPWVVYGVLRTADAMTPFLDHARAASISLLVFGANLHVHIRIRPFFYIYRLLRAGPAGGLIKPLARAVPNRPMSARR